MRTKKQKGGEYGSMKKIMFVTGSRGEWGYIRPILRLIVKRPDVEYRLVVTNMHLLPAYGNSYKEIESDLGIKEPDCGDLTKWAKEGVLLLNTTLTVREHQANSHSKCGWAWFTDSVIKLISENTENTVFILWGGNARSKVPLIDGAKHYILQCAHPSPLSAYNGFFGCRHFSKANAYLISHGKQPIDWDLN